MVDSSPAPWSHRDIDASFGASAVSAGAAREGRSIATAAPLSPSAVRELVLQGKLLPGDVLQDAAGAGGLDLRDRPEWIPFAELSRAILELYRDRLEDEALEWIGRFRGFDRGVHHGAHHGAARVERQYVRLVEGLIREKLEPATAEGLYQSLLSDATDERLVGVVHNNLAVLKFARGDLEAALEHIGVAVLGEPPILAALLNQAVILEQVLTASQRKRAVLLNATGWTPAEVESELKGIRARIRRCADDEKLRTQLTQKPVVPGAECATLITPDQAPVTTNVSTAAEDRALAAKCIDRAARALQNRRWEEVRMWSTEAERQSPGDAVVEAQAHRFRGQALVRQRADVVEEKHAEFEVSLERIRELEIQGRVHDALLEISVFSARLETAPAEPGGDGWRQELEQVAERLREGLARQRIEEARAVEGVDPREAEEKYRQASLLHGRSRGETEVRSGHLRFERLKGRFQDELGADHLEAAREALEAIEAIEELVPSLGRLDETSAMEAELGRRESRQDFERAVEALHRGDVARARRFAQSAVERHPESSEEAREVLEQALELEVQALAEATLVLLSEGKYDRILDGLLVADSEVVRSRRLRTLVEIAGILSDQKLPRKEHRELLTAVRELSSGDDEDAEGNAKGDAAAFAGRLESIAGGYPQSLTVTGRDGEVKLAERLCEAADAFRADAVSEAAELLVPVAAEMRLARALLRRVTERELRELNPTGTTVVRVLDLVMEAFGELAEGRPGVAAQKLQHALRAAPDLHVARLGLEGVLTQSLWQLERAEAAAEGGDLAAAATALAVFENSWGTAPLPAPVRARADRLARTVQPPAEEPAEVEGTRSRLGFLLQRLRGGRLPK